MIRRLIIRQPFVVIIFPVRVAAVCAPLIGDILTGAASSMRVFYDRLQQWQKEKHVGGLEKNDDL